MVNPKVTVLMGVYNGERYVEAAIDSILKQTYQNFEFLIIDDGSTDSTPQIIARCAAGDPRIVISRNEKNMGLTASLNKGLHLAHGDFIARQDADDLSATGRLESQVRTLDENSDVVLVSSNVDNVDANGKFLVHDSRACPPELVAWFLLFYNHVAGHSAVMFRTDTAKSLGGYNESFRYSQDHELWLRLAAEGKILILPETLLFHRQHGDNLSRQSTSAQEELSLVCSQKALSPYLGRTPSIRETSALRDFWLDTEVTDHRLAHLRSCFTIGYQLKKIADEYARSQRSAASPQLRKKLYRSIGQRVVTNRSFLSLRHPIKTVKLLLMASYFILRSIPMLHASTRKK